MEQDSLDDMYSDLSDEPLQKGSEVDLGSGDIGDLVKDGNFNGKIEDLVKSIEMKREFERAAKKERDIKPATVEDYFTGFSSTITKKVNNPKKIRSVMEEIVEKGKYLNEEQELAEIKKRFNQNDGDYME